VNNRQKKISKQKVKQKKELAAKLILAFKKMKKLAFRNSKKDFL
jgi:hypothetical protein